ncbi:MAG: hypothetical protein RLZ51_425, partial [Pseudomonadota bacterium]
MAERLIHPDKVHHWMRTLWERAGSNATEAKLTADHLVLANRSGHDSHGIGMAARYVKSFKSNELQLNQTVKIVADHGPMVTIDGMRGMGQ